MCIKVCIKRQTVSNKIEEMMRSAFTIYKRGKVYYACYVNPDGKNITRKSVNVLYTALYGIGRVKITKNQAYAIADEALKKDMVFNTASKTRGNGDILLVDYVRSIFDYDNSEYIRQKLAAKSNAITRSYCLDMLNTFNRHGAEYLEGITLRDFRPFMAENVKDTLLSNGFSGSTINKILQALRTALGEAYRKGLIEVNPAAGIININSEKRTRGIPSKKEVYELLKYLKEKYPAGSYERAAYLIVALAVYTGMRQGEIKALQCADIILKDSDESIIHIKHAYTPKDGLKCPKGKKARVVTAPTPLCAEILKYAEDSPNDYVFYSVYSKDKPISTETILKWYTDALDHVGIDEKERKKRYIDFHSLRHFFTSSMNSVLSDDDRRKLLGHASIEMTDHYTHMTPEYLEKMAKSRAEAIPYI